AAAALSNLGTYAVPHLIAALKVPDSRVQDEAARALGYMGAEAREAVPALAEMLKAPRFEHLLQASIALLRIGRDAVPALICALKDQDGHVRDSAVWILGRIGPEAEEALPALAEALGDRHWFVSHHAEQAIRWITEEDDGDR